MSLKDKAAAWLKTVVAAQLASNARRYSWSTWTGEVRVNALGGVTYLDPQEGKVVDASDEFLLVKTSPNNFCVVLKELLTEEPAIGAKVRMEFYQVRRFDGTKADGSEDAASNGCRSFMLAGAHSQFPVKWEGRYLGINERHAHAYREIQNPYLRDLITQMEAIPVDNGLRRSVNVLIDAGATDLDFVDPPEEQSVGTPPAIRFKVANAKFTGHVEINYDRPSDYYRVLCTKPYPSLDTEETERHEDVDFEQLASLLADLLDTEEWKKVKVTVLKAAPKQKAVPQPA
jgi:hypothetical protein